jgi:hypothetical protein
MASSNKRNACLGNEIVICAQCKGELKSYNAIALLLCPCNYCVILLICLMVIIYGIKYLFCYPFEIFWLLLHKDGRFDTLVFP